MTNLEWSASPELRHLKIEGPYAIRANDAYCPTAQMLKRLVIYHRSSDILIWHFIEAQIQC